MSEVEEEEEKKILRWPGVEPGSTAWKATMLTVTPPTLAYLFLKIIHYLSPCKCEANQLQYHYVILKARPLRVVWLIYMYMGVYWDD